MKKREHTKHPHYPHTFHVCDDSNCDAACVLTCTVCECTDSALLDDCPGFPVGTEAQAAIVAGQVRSVSLILRLKLSLAKGRNA